MCCTYLPHSGQIYGILDLFKRQPSWFFQLLSWGLNPGPHTCQTSALLMSYSHRPFFTLGQALVKLLRQALNLWSSCLNLWDTWGYGPVPHWAWARKKIFSKTAYIIWSTEGVPGQPGQHRETLSEEQNKTKQKKTTKWFALFFHPLTPETTVPFKHIWLAVDINVFDSVRVLNGRQHPCNWGQNYWYITVQKSNHFTSRKSQ